MERTYIVIDDASTTKYFRAKLIEPEQMMGIVGDIRIRILKLLKKKPMYPAEIAKKMKMHEQKVYYHIKQLQKSGAISVVEKQEKRGTIAKRYAPDCMNFCISLGEEEQAKGLGTIIIDEKLEFFLKEFTNPDGTLNAHIVVGSPDPHGPFKSRARDSHYSIELALFLGQFTRLPEEFAVKLDVDSTLDTNMNLILVGGPITNLLVSEINEHLPIKFSSGKPWGLVSGKKVYFDDAAGLIAKIKNPRGTGKLLVIAGVRHIGTKAAVMGLTRNWNKVLLPDEEWARVVEGYDVDGDGKIDEIEVLQ